MAPSLASKAGTSTANRGNRPTILSRAKVDLLYLHIDFCCRETPNDGLVLDRAGYRWLLGHGMTRPEIEQAIETLTRRKAIVVQIRAGNARLYTRFRLFMDRVAEGRRDDKAHKEVASQRMIPGQRPAE
jgi:hypothetical protein